MELQRAHQPGGADRTLRAKPRTQASLAVSADGERWLLLNASPDFRQQVAANAGAVAAGRAAAFADRGGDPDQRRDRPCRRAAVDARIPALRPVGGAAGAGRAGRQPDLRRAEPPFRRSPRGGAERPFSDRRPRRGPGPDRHRLSGAGQGAAVPGGPGRRRPVRRAGRDAGAGDRRQRGALPLHPRLRRDDAGAAGPAAGVAAGVLRRHAVARRRDDRAPASAPRPAGAWAI